MPGLSIHVVDVANGRVAEGMAASVWRVKGTGAVEIARGRVGSTGVVLAADLDRKLEPGVYEVRLEVGAYYTPLVTHNEMFLDDLVFRFLVCDPELHIHLPFKLTPFGFACFRGA